MFDPSNELFPRPSSPTTSSVSSNSDLDSQSTGSFFHDRSTTLGTLMGVTPTAIAFRAPSQGCETFTASVSSTENNVGSRRARKVNRKKKSVASSASSSAEYKRRSRWWSLCKDDELKPSKLGDFLEVERRFGDVAFFGVEAEIGSTQQRQGRLLFADGRVLPPADVEMSASSGISPFKFPVSLTGICTGCIG